MCMMSNHYPFHVSNQMSGQGSYSEHQTRNTSPQYTVIDRYSYYCWHCNPLCNSPLIQCCTMTHQPNCILSVQYTHCTMMYCHMSHCVLPWHNPPHKYHWPPTPWQLLHIYRLQRSWCTVLLWLLTLSPPSRDSPLDIVCVHPWSDVPHTYPNTHSYHLGNSNLCLHSSLVPRQPLRHIYPPRL